MVGSSESSTFGSPRYEDLYRRSKKIERREIEWREIVNSRRLVALYNFIENFVCQRYFVLYCLVFCNLANVENCLESLTISEGVIENTGISLPGICLPSFRVDSIVNQYSETSFLAESQLQSLYRNGRFHLSPESEECASR